VWYGMDDMQGGRDRRGERMLMTVDECNDCDD